MGRKSPMVKIPEPHEIDPGIYIHPGSDLYTGKRSQSLVEQDKMIIAALRYRNLSYSQIQQFYEQKLNRVMNRPTIVSTIRSLAKEYRESANKSYEELAGQQIAHYKMMFAEARANYEHALALYEDEVMKTKRRISTTAPNDKGDPITSVTETEEVVDDNAVRFWWNEMRNIESAISEILGLERRRGGLSIHMGDKIESTTHTTQKAYVNLNVDKAWDTVLPENQAHGLALQDGKYQEIIDGEFSDD